MKNIALFILKNIYVDGIDVDLPDMLYSTFISKLKDYFDTDIDCINYSKIIINNSYRSLRTIKDIEKDLCYIILDSYNCNINVKYKVKIHDMNYEFNNINEFELFAERYNKLAILV